MRIAGLIGDPVAHSLSPVMHNAAFAHLGIDARYELWLTPLDALRDRVEALRAAQYYGANVTVPHKEAVLPFVDELSDTVRRIGAANTIVNRDGALLGENTDAYGFERALQDIVGNAEIGLAVVVGAGGASRAVLVALQDAGAHEIVLANRTVEKAEALAEELSVEPHPRIQAAGLEALPDLAIDTAIVVNATSVGWHGDELPIPASMIDALPGHAIVADLTYRQTALLALAAGRGLATMDGLPMLIHQGARSFELWTGESAPVDVMTAAVRAEQTRRD